MSSLKERFSNVIAWLGFLFIMGGVLALIISQYYGGPQRQDFLAFLVFGVVPWLALGVVNYLFSGRLRLFP